MTTQTKALEENIQIVCQYYWRDPFFLPSETRFNEYILMALLVNAKAVKRILTATTSSKWQFLVLHHFFPVSFLRGDDMWLPRSLLRPEHLQQFKTWFTKRFVYCKCWLVRRLKHETVSGTSSGLFGRICCVSLWESCRQYDSSMVGFLRWKESAELNRLTRSKMRE